MRQLVFSRTLAIRLRELGIAQVETGARPDWRDAALFAVHCCASVHDRFIVDAVWPFIPDGYDTHELRAMGAVMRRASNLGWIEPTSEFKASDRASAHRNPRRIWRSRLR